MNAVLVLVGLLVLAYVGSLLVGSDRTRGLGLPSGIEYVLFGLVLGPQLLGLVDRETVRGFEPILVTALGWYAFGVGLDWGRGSGQRAGVRGGVLGVLYALITAAVVGGATYWAAGPLLGLQGRDRLILAAGLGIVLSDTTRYATTWVMHRYGARGPLTRLFADLTDVDDVVPLFALVAVLALVPQQQSTLVLPPGVLLALPLAFGVALGILTVALVEKELASGQVWGFLLGTLLLAAGTAVRLDLPAVSVTFLMGLAVRIFSKHAGAISALVLPTEKPVMLPTLVLAGAMVDLRLGTTWLAVIAGAVVVRVAVKVALGSVLALGPARGAALQAGLALTPSGALAVLVGLSFSLRLPGTAGQAVLAASVASAILGELFGTAAMRRVLEQAGELPSEARPEATGDEPGASGDGSLPEEKPA